MKKGRIRNLYMNIEFWAWFSFNQSFLNNIIRCFFHFSFDSIQMHLNASFHGTHKLRCKSAICNFMVVPNSNGDFEVSEKKSNKRNRANKGAYVDAAIHSHMHEPFTVLSKHCMHVYV